MTTLAYRDGVLASDSRATNGDRIETDGLRKIARTRSGALVGAVGVCTECAAFVRWTLAGEPDGECPNMGGSTGIIISPKGTVRVFDGSGWMKLDRRRFYAWGSGADGALTAMHVGASARRAVWAATKVDFGSGGRVRSVQLKG